MKSAFKYHSDASPGNEKQLSPWHGDSSVPPCSRHRLVRSVCALMAAVKHPGARIEFCLLADSEIRGSIVEAAYGGIGRTLNIRYTEDNRPLS